MAFDLDGYVDVAERISIFREKYPDGSLQPYEPFQVTEIGGQHFIVYVAAAYRNPDDPRPGVGVAWEPFPGKTPYTRDSELMNAETSAWGRAIVAALAADTQKIASVQEVRNRRDADSPGGVGRDRGDSRPSTTPGRPTSNDEDEAWLNFAENPAGWWDNRKDKRNPKAPDLKAKKGTEVAKDGLWLSNLKKRHHGEEPVEVDEFLSERNCLGVAIEDWGIDTVAGYVALMLGVEPEPKAERKKTMRTDDVAAELGAEVVDDGAPF